MWGWLMEFWRTLFNRHHGPNKAFQVAPITPAVPYAPISPTPLPTFQTLVFSSTAFVRSAPSSGTINNATTGSLIIAAGLPAGITIDSALRTWAWDGTGTAGSGSFTLYENIPGAASNPNISAISYAITGALGQLTFNAAADSGLLALLEDI